MSSPKKELRTYRRNIRFTESEFMHIKERAKELDMKDTEYIRHASVSSTIIRDKKITKELIAQTARIGNNLNQIAHSLNRARLQNKLGEEDYTALIEKLDFCAHYLNELSKG